MQITIFVNIVSDRDVCTLLWFLLMLLARSRAWPWDGRTLRLMLAFVVSVKRCNGFRQVCFSLRLISHATLHFAIDTCRFRRFDATFTTSVVLT